MCVCVCVCIGVWSRIRTTRTGVVVAPLYILYRLYIYNIGRLGRESWSHLGRRDLIDPSVCLSVCMRLVCLSACGSACLLSITHTTPIPPSLLTYLYLYLYLYLYTSTYIHTYIHTLSRIRHLHHQALGLLLRHHVVVSQVDGDALRDTRARTHTHTNKHTNTQTRTRHTRTPRARAWFVLSER